MDALCRVMLGWMAIASVVPGIASAGDWPQFRGPNRDSAWNETELLETFPSGGLKIHWRVPAGFGWSSPVVARGRAFLIDSELVKPSARERVRCFDEATGKTLWTFAYEVAYPEWGLSSRPRWRADGHADRRRGPGVCRRRQRSRSLPGRQHGRRDLGE